MTKRGRKLHQTMARRTYSKKYGSRFDDLPDNEKQYIIANRCQLTKKYGWIEGGTLDYLYPAINFGNIQQEVDAAANAIYQFAERVAETMQTWVNVIEPWYQANREAIEAAIQSNPASVQRQLLEMSFADRQQNSDLPRAHTEPGGHNAFIEPRA